MQFTKDIEAGNVEGMMERLRSLISSIPYDNYSEEKVQLREQNYQAAVYLVFALMGQFVQSEVHCSSSTAMEGGGSTQRQTYTRRYRFDVADCVVETGDAIYLFEFKLSGSGSAEEALDQIKERQYATPHLVSGKKVVLIGSSFDEKARTLKEWAVASG
ncbi:MAG: PD-(D/E)XK nuclease domain-containing protein [Treponema sp.]